MLVTLHLGNRQRPPAAYRHGVRHESGDGDGVNVEFRLKTNTGLRAQLETADDSAVTLKLRGKNRLVSYAVRGEVTEE